MEALGEGGLESRCGWEQKVLVQLYSESSSYSQDFLGLAGLLDQG